MSIVEMNTAICEALGIDMTGAQRIDITLTTDDVPRIHVYRIVTDLSDRVEKVEFLRVFDLVERST